MDIMRGVKGWTTAKAPMREPTRGKEKAEGIAFTDPRILKTKRSIKEHLCEGLKSPCKNCEIQCGYGRRWMEMQREGIAAC